MSVDSSQMGAILCRGASYFAGLVLCDLVLSVLFAGLALAIGAASLGNVDLGATQSAHQSTTKIPCNRKKIRPRLRPLLFSSQM